MKCIIYLRKIPMVFICNIISENTSISVLILFKTPIGCCVIFWQSVSFSSPHSWLPPDCPLSQLSLYRSHPTHLHHTRRTEIFSLLWRVVLKEKTDIKLPFFLVSVVSILELKVELCALFFLARLAN